MRLLIIFMLAAASLPAQNLKFKIKQLPKDTSVGRVVLSSLTDSTMTYSDLLKIDNDSLYFKGSGVLTSAMNVGGIVDLATDVTGTLPVANGGTGSATQNFVDLSSAQTVGGAKTFTSALTQSGGDVNFDNNTLYVDATNNRVGIGTSSPLAPLSIGADGDTLFSNSVGRIARFTNASGTSGFNMGYSITEQLGVFISQGDNSGISYWTNNGSWGERMRIHTNGNVGIGTDSPSAKLDVAGSMIVDDSTLYVDATNNRVGIGTSSPLAPLSIGADGDTLFSNSVGRIARFTNASGTSGFNMGYSITEQLGVFISQGDNSGISYWTNNGSWGERMRIHTNGNVGIGTTNPTAKLEVNGSATNTSSNGESDATIDFSLSNIATTSSESSTITLNNIKDGGAYTLITTAINTTTVVTFTASGFDFKYMGTVARTSNKRHLYSFIVAGTYVYVTMATEN